MIPEKEWYTFLRIWQKQTKELRWKPEATWELRSKAGNLKLGQLIWLLKNYLKQAPLQQDSEDFVAFVVSSASDSEIPEEGICLAYATGIRRAIVIADHIETLKGAWFRNPEVDKEIANLLGILDANRALLLEKLQK